MHNRFNYAVGSRFAMWKIAGGRNGHADDILSVAHLISYGLVDEAIITRGESIVNRKLENFLVF